MQQVVIRHSEDEQGRWVLDLPYDERFKERFKDAVPGDCREWLKAQKRWAVDMDYYDEVLALIRDYWPAVRLEAE